MVDVRATTVESKDVDFIDYDGTLLYSYTAEEFLALTEMPANPSHDGLVAQGWNWTLADAQAYVQEYGGQCIGQMYETADGKTHIFIELAEGRLAPYLGLGLNGTAEIDWGDGSAVETMTGANVGSATALQHTYSVAGEYEIIVSVTGSAQMLNTQNRGRLISDYSSWQNVAYQNAIKKIYIPNNFSMATYALSYFYSLEALTLPTNITVLNNYLFQFCYSLIAVITPNSVQTLNANVWRNCGIKKVSLPNSVEVVGGTTFYECKQLERIFMPAGLTTYNNYFCYSCDNVKEIVMASGVLSVGANSFYQLFALKKIKLANTITQISNSGFYNCYSLTELLLPSALETISSNAIYGLTGLTGLIIPASVQTIGSGGIGGCYGLGFIKFEGSTPPTLSASNSLSLPTDCIIYVPAGTLEAYTTATNYPSSSTYNYVEY